MLSLDADVLRIAQKVREVGRVLDERYLDKGELVRMLLVTLVAGEHMLIVGPPGTAKSALIRHLARLVDARYFEYLLTRFSEPNEIFGPIDIKAFREGSYVRRVEAMLPDADIVFLDEIFKSNSAILNSLLSILNERRFFTGSASIQVPLSSMYGATNEIPNDDALSAVFDRFLVRTLSDNLDSFHFHGLIERGLRGEVEALAALGAGEAAVEGATRPLVSLAEIRLLKGRLAQHLQFPEDFLARYKGLVFQIRSEGVTLSDRRVVKLLKLFGASALIDGRPTVGVIYDPMRDELFSAVAGWGAMLDSRPIRMPDKEQLVDCLISLAMPWSGYRRREAAIRRATRVSRNLGSSALALAYASNGRFDIFVQLRSLSNWDVAAAGLIGSAYGITAPSFQTLAFHQSPPHRANVVTATYFTFYDLGLGAGAYLAGVLIPHLGYANLYLLLNPFVLSAAVLYYVICRRK
jgi:MoxR-like ATPase